MRGVLLGFWGAGGAAVLAYPFAAEAVQTALYSGVSAASVVAVAVGVHVHRPALRLPWFFLITALTCSLAGDIGFEIYEGVAGDVPFPSFLDALYLLFYPLLLVVLGSFLNARGRRDPTAWVDASVWTIGIATALWEPFIEPTLTAAGSSVLGDVVAMAYPVLDLFLLLMVLRIVVGRPSLDPATLLLTGALVLQIGLDTVYGAQEVAGTYAAGGVLDTGWMVVSLLLGAMALHPSMRSLTQRSHRPPRQPTYRQLQALLVPALVPVGLLLHLHLVAPSYDLVDELVAVLALAGLLVLVVARGVGLLRLAEQRSDQLSERSAALQVALRSGEQIAEQLRTRIDRDQLTGLSSRSRFVERVDAAVAGWQRGGPAPSVAFLDLDDFKTINDTLGHEAGDRLLQALGQRMRSHLAADDVVARLGGDEFAVLLLRGDAEQIAAQLVTALQAPLPIEGRLLRPHVSIGLTTVHDPGSSTSDLLAEADIAMYAAKRAGCGWQRYRPGMSAALRDRVDVTNQLVRALRAGAVQPWFQPVVDLASGRLLGFEALARWTTDGGTPRPSEGWLPLAEETGIIVDIDREVLGLAVQQLAAWRRVLPASTLTMAVNFSGRTLQTPGIDDEVLALLAQADVPTALLTLEVTEGVLLEEHQVGDRLRRLRAAGVVVGLDDFGTGWSSLNYLRRFPVDHLKLDRSFTQDLGRSPVADTIPSAIAQIARGLSLGLVAEGVETPDQRTRLLELGFTTGQGYLFGRAQRGPDIPVDVLAGVAPVQPPAAPVEVLPVPTTST